MLKTYCIGFLIKLILILVPILCCLTFNRWFYCCLWVNIFGVVVFEKIIGVSTIDVICLCHLGIVSWNLFIFRLHFDVDVNLMFKITWIYIVINTFVTGSLTDMPWMFLIYMYLIFWTWNVQNILWHHMTLNWSYETESYKYTKTIMVRYSQNLSLGYSGYNS